jgi:hypothetical protein
VSSRLLHEALAPYLIVATDNTWFSYACARQPHSSSYWSLSTRCASLADSVGRAR